MASKANKTTPTSESVEAFLAKLTPERQEESQRIIAMMRDVTGHDPVMWGPSIIGFGRYHYIYETGREGDAPAAGFSPRKANLVVYLADGVDQYHELLDTLGSHSNGKSCLYIKRLAAVDADVLREIVEASYANVMSQLDRPRGE